MSNVFVAGHRGMVGSAICRQLEGTGVRIITADRAKLDLCNQQSVNEFFASENISSVILAAAKVGGIHANSTYPATFLYENLMVEANVIHAAHCNGVQDLLFLGSSCIYPRMAPQPMQEESLLTGFLEPTNEPYAIAKIAGIKLCESYNRQYGRDYRSVMPTNLYGPNDNFHSENSHVIPALIKRFHAAAESNDAEIVVWGSGTPRREFLHVDDMAAACLHVFNLTPDVYSTHTQPTLSHVNVGIGSDMSIRELAETMARVTNFKGKLVFDASKPDGPPRKLLDVGRLTEMGWQAKIKFEDGLRDTYEWYLKNIRSHREV